MPSDVIKSFAKKSGKSEEEVEKLWKEAKAKAEEQGLEDEKMYAYATAILKKMVGLDEAYDVGDKVSYTSVKSGKRVKKGTIVKVEKKNGDTRYELDNGAFVYDSDLVESTDTADVAVPDAPAQTGPAGHMPCGSPYFNCSDDQFWTLHTKSRGDKQWFNKHYQDSGIADWARANKGKNFYLKHESGMFRKIKAK